MKPSLKVIVSFLSGFFLAVLIIWAGENRRDHMVRLCVSDHQEGNVMHYTCHEERQH